VPSRITVQQSLPLGRDCSDDLVIEVPVQDAGASQSFARLLGVNAVLAAVLDEQPRRFLFPPSKEHACVLFDRHEEIADEQGRDDLTARRSAARCLNGSSPVAA
jgi:hypothetical protein